MGKKFADLKEGDQVELTAKSFRWSDDGRDPDRPMRAAVVTHVWYDPVDQKEYLALAYLSENGDFGQPREKRTRTGLARAGWEHARHDWVVHLQGLNSGAVTPIWKSKRAKPNPIIPRSRL